MNGRKDGLDDWQAWIYKSIPASAITIMVKD